MDMLASASKVKFCFRMAFLLKLPARDRSAFKSKEVPICHATTRCESCTPQDMQLVKTLEKTSCSSWMGGLQDARFGDSPRFPGKKLDYIFPGLWGFTPGTGKIMKNPKKVSQTKSFDGKIPQMHGTSRSFPRSVTSNPKTHVGDRRKTVDTTGVEMEVS